MTIFFPSRVPLEWITLPFSKTSFYLVNGVLGSFQDDDGELLLGLRLNFKKLLLPSHLSLTEDGCWTLLVRKLDLWAKHTTNHSTLQVILWPLELFWVFKNLGYSTCRVLELPEQPKNPKILDEQKPRATRNLNQKPASTWCWVFSSMFFVMCWRFSTLKIYPKPENTP